MQRQLLEAVIHHCPNPAQRVIIWHTILKIDIAVHHTLLFVFSTHAACITELPVKMWYQPWCNLNFSAACLATEVLCTRDSYRKAKANRFSTRRLSGSGLLAPRPRPQ